ncbi:hypothetical protein BO71DRAFT_225927 [Aspergillus ellipticus CBS 707.79]|uniref:Transmembrane protein n=1 Tax=Aspergillus ellipticus CBS 707.79 TaxID=1448320 RepID=A0A319DB66_9EURO|nr:hypothetical protein BO71DRAFT_225927 [Aspergillus ellipticus CBS 707.79]
MRSRQRLTLVPELRLLDRRSTSGVTFISLLSLHPKLLFRVTQFQRPRFPGISMTSRITVSLADRDATLFRTGLTRRFCTFLFLFLLFSLLSFFFFIASSFSSLPLSLL